MSKFFLIMTSMLWGAFIGKMSVVFSIYFGYDVTLEGQLIGGILYLVMAVVCYFISRKELKDDY